MIVYITDMKIKFYQERKRKQNRKKKNNLPDAVTAYTNHN